jgi:tetratricopeptide (TPR) repeat protein
MTLHSAQGSLLGKIAGYVEILAKDPRSTVFVPLAETYRQMGLLEDALEVATKGVQALPSFSPGYSLLGRIQAQLGRLDAAASSFEKALLIDPEGLMDLKGLARIRMRQGDPVQALKLVQRALALKPDDAVAQKMLAALGTSSGTPDVPVRQQTPAPQPSPGPISTPTIAEIYIRQGFFNRAMKVYRDLLQADPLNEEIRRKLVELKRRVEALKASTAKGVLVVPAPVPAAGEIQVAQAPAPVAAEEGNEAQAPELEVRSRQLEQLSRWVDSIQRRRADVQ